MVLQKAVKSYPMVKWFLILSAILVILGLVMSKVLSDPDNADTMTLLMFIGAAAVLPFLAMLFPRRKVFTLETPTDSLAGMSKSELEGVLGQLDAAKAKGEMDDTRYAKARERVLDAIKSRGKAAK
jgi:hypothetical protein